MTMPKRSTKAKRHELTTQPDPKAPLDVAAFMAQMKRAQAALTEDMLARADGSRSITVGIKAHWEKAKAQGLTADAFEVWRRLFARQTAAHWLLSVLFVRTLEDRGLVPRNRVAGEGAEDSQKQFFQLFPYLTERDYLLTVFEELCAMPAASDIWVQILNMCTGVQ